MFHTRHLFFSWVLVYFSLARISSALIPLASSFLTTLSASAFFASSAALASAFAFFASKEVSSFSAFFKADFFSFSVFFCSSIAFWMDAISVFRDAIVSCFSVIFSLWGQTPMFLFTRLYRLRFTLYIFSIKMALESIPNCLQIIFFNFPHDVFPL